MATGIRKRHSRRCRSYEGGACNCEPSFEASVYSKRDDKKIRRAFRSQAEARSWRADAVTKLGQGALRAPRPTTVRQAWEAWYEGAQSGTIRNRSGDRYKPGAVRSYERAMRLRVLPAMGSVRLADVRGPDLQEFADRLLAERLNPSTIDVTVLPLRAIFRRAVSRGELAVNPCTGLQLPAIRSRRERFASVEETDALLAALPTEDRAIWATALLAGLRRGELMALHVEDIDLASGVIRVEREWDDREGEQETKGRDRRRVPIVPELRDYLAEHVMRTGREGSQLAFGRTPADPFVPGELTKRADRAWRAAELDRITLHECRHSFAALMIAAGVNAYWLSRYMGHSDVAFTLRRYGHLMPGAEEEAAGLLDVYLSAQREQVDERARKAGADLTGAHTGAQLAHKPAKPH